jgi:hypothetical protein
VYFVLIDDGMIVTPVKRAGTAQRRAARQIGIRHGSDARLLPRQGARDWYEKEGTERYA